MCSIAFSSSWGSDIMATPIMWHVCIKTRLHATQSVTYKGYSSKQWMHVYEQQLMPVLVELSFGAGLSGDPKPVE